MGRDMRRVRLIAPLWWKACLHEPPPERRPDKRGRPAKVGAALPKLKMVLADPKSTLEFLVDKQITPFRILDEN